jgi:hypothetical protein
LGQMKCLGRADPPALLHQRGHKIQQRVGGAASQPAVIIIFKVWKAKVHIAGSEGRAEMARGGETCNQHSLLNNALDGVL